MTVASIQLHNGDTVSVELGNDDGTITQAEIDDAVARLEAEMNNAAHPGTEYIDHNARIRLTEHGVTIERSAETLLRNGAVQLFGNNPMRTTSTGTFDNNPAMWRPIGFEVGANGTRYTIYREVDRWDATAGRMVEGRTVRVTSGGRREIERPGTADNPDPTWALGTVGDHIPNLTFLAPSEIDGLSEFARSRIASRGDGAGADVRVGVDTSSSGTPGPRLSRDWVYDGTRTVDGVEYQYWHDPANPRAVARNRANDPVHTSEINNSGGTGMWFCPADTLLAPATATPPAQGGIYTERAVSPRVEPFTLRTNNGSQNVTLTPMQQTVHVVDGRPVLFDQYTTTAGEGGATTTFRRRHDGTGGWEVATGANWTAIPANAIAAVQAAPTVRVGTGDSAPVYTLRPASPAVSGNFEMFMGSISGTSAELRFRRPRGSDGPYQVFQGGRWVAPDTGRPVAVTGGGNGSGSRPARRPSGPDVFY